MKSLQELSVLNQEYGTMSPEIRIQSPNPEPKPESPRPGPEPLKPDLSPPSSKKVGGAKEAAQQETPTKKRSALDLYEDFMLGKAKS